MTYTEFTEAQSEILQDVPEEFHSVISSMAWERGHSAGYHEVLIHARDLVSGLKPAIESFAKNQRQVRT